MMMQQPKTTMRGAVISTLLSPRLRFAGGSAIGDGACFRKGSPAPALFAKLGGYLKIEARNRADARSLLVGHPVYEGGGTVEIRERPRT
jgi:hypothetical protein